MHGVGAFLRRVESKRRALELEDGARALNDGAATSGRSTARPYDSQTASEVHGRGSQTKRIDGSISIDWPDEDRPGIFIADSSPNIVSLASTGIGFGMAGHPSGSQGNSEAWQWGQLEADDSRVSTVTTSGRRSQRRVRSKALAPAGRRSGIAPFAEFEAVTDSSALRDSSLAATLRHEKLPKGKVRSSKRKGRSQVKLRSTAVPRRVPITGYAARMGSG